MIRPLLLTLTLFCSGLYFACQSEKEALKTQSSPVVIDMSDNHQDSLDLSALEQNCFKCHGADKQKGKVRFDLLHKGSMTREKMALIKESIALIKEGEMPPKKEAVLSASQKQQIEQAFTSILAQNIEASRDENRTVYRRLNNQEYLNTVSELFGFDSTVFDPTVNFPADQRHEGLNTMGSELISTKFLTKEYLNAANLIVDKMLRFDEKPAPHEYSFNYRTLETRAKDDHSAILYGSFHSGDNYQGSEIHLKDFKAPDDGFYTFKIKATAKNRRHDLPKEIVYNDQDEPLRLGLKTGHHSNATMHFVFDLADQENWYDCRIWLNKGQSPQLVYPNAIYSAHNYRFNLSNIPDIHTRLGLPKEAIKGKITNGYNNGRGHVYKNIYDVVKKLPVPKIHVNKVKVSGPFYDDWSPKQNNKVLLGQKLKMENWQSLLMAFAGKAFRKPVNADDIQVYKELVSSQLNQGEPLKSAFKTGIKALLCSPKFLFIEEKNKQLNQFEIANRLSYFLWSSMPDKNLFTAAQKNELKSDAQILDQVERMLADKKADEFVKNFSSSWLQFYKLGGILPHNKIFKDYYRMNIQESSKKETFLYFKYVLQENRTIIDFLDSDYSILDRRLAKLYQLPTPILENVLDTNDYNGKAPSTGFVKYKFNDQRRGGLMGHTSVLTVSANGVDTSPVIRGVWILETLLCSPPPPAPADVAAIDPDTRGAKTIKERLKKHKNDPNCSSCHKKIDPIGFALENYNPVGQWRDRYKRRQTIDASGNMNGQEFKNIIGFKKALLEKSDDFAEAFAEKMLSYAIGRTPTFLDDEQIVSLQSDFKKSNYQLKDLIRLICTNSLFIQK